MSELYFNIIECKKRKMNRNTRKKNIEIALLKYRKYVYLGRQFQTKSFTLKKTFKKLKERFKKLFVTLFTFKIKFYV